MTYTVILNCPDPGDADDPFEYIGKSTVKESMIVAYSKWLSENVPQDDCTIFLEKSGRVDFLHEHDATAFMLKFYL